MHWTVHDLKVDQTVLSSDNSVIFVTNINIPVANLEEQQVIDRAYNFIQSEYAHVPSVQYQVTATYELRNTLDNSVRQWSGSFSPRNNLHGSLTPFEYFDQTFIPRVQAACDLNYVRQKLTLRNVNTNYVFERLTSIVINVQAAVPANFERLIQRNLFFVRNGRHYRNQITFALP